MDLRLNEFMANPASDWNRDGEVNQEDEYIELINLRDSPVDLAGLLLDDKQDETLPYILTGTLEIGEIALFFRDQTGIALDDRGWEFVKLLAADGSLLDGCSYTTLMEPDMAWSRDEEGMWHDNWLPSPKMPNHSPVQPTVIFTPQIQPQAQKVITDSNIFASSNHDLTSQLEASNELESPRWTYIYGCFSIVLVILLLSLVRYGYKRYKQLKSER
jgi:hypothetical protein